ncbi:beta-barrel assembly-enhancing protease [Thalassotalea agarivorans]|uniref:Putative beta-barrel assembly-enhancing protease n=1 Tax=Thalassotalea agarivorans TaxID=349064 RepID=A0A1I0FLZ0_THASX|nr:M48 family metalloprotease [Thalassotalea agarivorans]SET58290.1 Putative Zn-dependent protease, contains TPR repeats [Thalassotalea agarivorans]
MLKFKPLLLATCIASTALAPHSFALQNDKNKLPEIGSAGSSVLSVEKERQIGDAMMRQLRATQPILHDPVLTEYINDIGNRMVKHANDVNYGFEFFFIRNQELNAFAFFGGHIAIHTGLLVAADTESELASVIGHEISHVTQRHLARRLESQSNNQPVAVTALVSSILLALVNPTAGMAALSTTMAASQQASINYTRGNEKEADRVGIALLSASGFDPQGAPQFFAKLSEAYRYSSKPPAMLLTHPLPESRITDARLRAQNMPSVQLPPSLAFELSKSRIKARYQGNAKSNIANFNHQLNRNTYALKEAAEYGLALSLYENNQAEDAKVILESLRSNDRNNLFYVDALSDVYIKTKEFDKATDMLSQLARLMPNNQVVTLNYANVLHEAGRNEEAAQVLQDFLLVKRDNFLAYDLLTSIYKELDKPALMHSAKAEVYAMLGVYQKAIDELQTGYNFTKNQPLLRKRIKARVLQFQDALDKVKRL